MILTKLLTFIKKSLRNMSNGKKIKCPRPECGGNGEYQYLGEEKSLTVVDEDGKVVYAYGKYVYKCMSCNMTFTTEISPQSKKLIHG